MSCSFDIAVSLRLAAIGHGIRGDPLGIEFTVRCTTVKVGQKEVLKRLIRFFCVECLCVVLGRFDQSTI